MKSGVVTQQSFSGKKTVRMFFKLALLCSIVSCVVAAPASTDVVPLEKQQPTVIPIVSESESNENGSYKFSYETANGIKREEVSYEKVIPSVRSGDEQGEGDSSSESNEIHVQEGSYSYVAPDGTFISVRYIADENGFQPVREHLPNEPEKGKKNENKRARNLNPSSESNKFDSKLGAGSTSENPKESSSPSAPKSESSVGAEASTITTVPKNAATEPLLTTAATPAETTTVTELTTTAETPSSEVKSVSEFTSTTTENLPSEETTVTQLPSTTSENLSSEVTSVTELSSTTAAKDASSSTGDNLEDTSRTVTISPTEADPQELSSTTKTDSEAVTKVSEDESPVSSTRDEVSSSSS